MSLTDDEFTCLSICGQGESLAAIGRWKPSVESLVAKGFLQHHDIANHTITPKGREALAQREKDADEAYWQILQTAGQLQNGRSQAQLSAEEAAQALAVAARASSAVTGKPASNEVIRWGAVVVDRAMEILDDRPRSGRPVLLDPPR